ncbi:RNA polymerase subunit sigma-70 [Kitasatospora sp. NPDC056181]|uniref:RNA polymerase subunit sigma-70 n=1 Tax=Kitasatospora sp. NPDC056181 TaxID=3345737 RepID=UPI0035D5F18B
MSEGRELAAAAGSRDPAVGLRAVRALRDLADRLEGLQVGNARQQGWSWQDIAVCLGVSRQAVHKKYARRGGGESGGDFGGEKDGG